MKGTDPVMTKDSSTFHGGNRKANREGRSSLMYLLGQAPPLPVWFAIAGAPKEPEANWSSKHKNIEREPEGTLTVQLDIQNSHQKQQCNQTAGPPPNARRRLREGWYEDGLWAVRGLTEEEGA